MSVASSSPECPKASDHSNGYTSPQVFVLGAIVAGILARVLLMLVAHGSNDMATWADFANRIITYGLLDTYSSMPLFNHPPLMGWYAALCQLFANGTGIPFAWCFKLPIVVLDGVAVWLIATHWAEKRGKWVGMTAAAVFSLNPVSVLVTSYHGNTDSLCAVLGLCAVILHHRQRHGLAGLVLGAAINVKLIAVLWIPGLLLLCLTWRQAWKFMLALSIAGIPFLIPLVGTFEAFSRNALNYNSIVDSWGVNLVPLFFKNRFPWLADFLLQDYRAVGRYVILGSVALSAVLGRYKGWSVATTATMALGIFLVLTPGFGIQYLVWIVPVMAVASLRWSAAWAVTAGSFALWVYVSYVISPYPIESSHGTAPRPLGMWGATAWGLIVAYVLSTATGLTQSTVWRRFKTYVVERVRDYWAKVRDGARQLSRTRRRQLVGGIALGSLLAFVAVTEYTRFRMGQDKAEQAAWSASSSFMQACTSPEKKCGASPQFFFHTLFEPSPWIRLDLGKPERISSVYVVNRNDCCRDRATPLVVEVGDGETWTEVARTRLKFSSWWPSFDPVTARYVRIRVDGSNFLHLQDVKVL